LIFTYAGSGSTSNSLSLGLYGTQVMTLTPVNIKCNQNVQLTTTVSDYLNNVGTAGQLLTSQGTNVQWATPTGGVWCFNSAGNITSSTTYFYVPGYNSTATLANAEQVMSRSVTITYIYVQLSAAPTSTNTRTFTFYKNGSATSASIVITGSATSGYWSTNINLVQGDLITIQATQSGATASIVYGSITYY